MKKTITKKVVESEVNLVLSGEEVICLANSLTHLYNYAQGSVSPRTEKLMHEFEELAKELNPLY